MPRNLFTLRRPRTANPCVLLFCLALLPPALYGCGGGGGGSQPTPAIPVSVSVGEKSAAVVVNGTQAFSATVAHAANTAVTWSVQEGAAGGSITSAGVYTAPSTAGTYHVVATSQQDPTKNSVVVVTVVVNVSVLPALATLSISQSLTFTAQVAGSVNQGVVWSVQEPGGGTITPAGVYTTPNQRGTFHVIATSVADNSRTSTATITVKAGSASGTIQ